MISPSDSIPASSSIGSVSPNGTKSSPVKSSGDKPISVVNTKMMYVWRNPVTYEQYQFSNATDKYRSHIKLILDANSVDNSSRVADILAPLIPTINYSELQNFYEYNEKLFDNLSKAEGYRLSLS